MRAGKKNTYIFSQIVSIEDDASSVIDGFRRQFGRHWFANREEIKYGSSAYEEDWERRLGVRILFGDIRHSQLRSSPFHNKIQHVYLQGDPEKWVNAEQTGDDWESFVRFMIPTRDNPSPAFGSSFYDGSGRLTDISFVIHTPLDNRKGEVFGDGSGLGHFKVDFEYNYYVANYENTISNMPENLLPSIYAVLSEGLGKPSKNMRSLLTMAGQMPRAKAKLSKIFHKTQDGSSDRKNIKDYNYFLKASFALGRIPRNERESRSENYKNFIFPSENIANLSDLGIKEKFPMYTDIQFSTDKTTNIAQILDDASLGTSLVRQIAAASEMDNDQSAAYLDKKSLLMLRNEQLLSSDGRVVGNKNSSGTCETLDVLRWWENYIRGNVPKNIFSKQTIVGPNTYSVYVSSGTQQNDLSQAIQCLVFSGKIGDEIKSNLRSFEDIWKGVSNRNSETVLYCVEKYDAQTRRLLQKYWFPNSNEIDVINFVDTQVAYNKQYTYSANAYQLVYGEEYDYTNLEINPQNLNIDIIQSCQDLPAIRLSGLKCTLEPTALQMRECVYRDAEKIVENVLPVLEGRYHDFAHMIATAYVSYGKVSALLSPLYVGYLAYAFEELGVATARIFVRNLSNTLRNVAHGEITLEKEATPEVRASIQRESFLARVTVTTRPILKLVRVPYFSRTGYIMDSPPVFPEVQIYPYKGKSNKLLLWLNSNMGEYNLYPQIVEQSDIIQNRRLLQKNNLRPSDPLLYKTDDYVREFQVYRLLEKPEAYSDFAGNIVANLKTGEIAKTSNKALANFKASSASMVDDIQPNTKYYYMFRSIDTHGLVSYPSHVYEVELVDNDGAVYPIINVIELEEKETPYDMQKVARKLIQIVPRVTQGAFNMQKSGLNDGSLPGPTSISATAASSYVLGVEDQSLWGKKFKIRMISKSTNKKVDVNVTFTRSHIITPEEVEIRKSGILTSGITEEERASSNVENYYRAYRYYAEHGEAPPGFSGMMRTGQTTSATTRSSASPSAGATGPSGAGGGTGGY